MPALPNLAVAAVGGGWPALLWQWRNLRAGVAVGSSMSARRRRLASVKGWRLQRGYGMA